MPTVVIDGSSIHKPQADCDVSDAGSLLQVNDMRELEMKALPEEICPDCFPELAP